MLKNKSDARRVVGYPLWREKNLLIAVIVQLVERLLAKQKVREFEPRLLLQQT